jgi:hypothetical protein
MASPIIYPGNGNTSSTSDFTVGPGDVPRANWFLAIFDLVICSNLIYVATENGWQWPCLIAYITYKWLKFP